MTSHRRVVGLADGRATSHTDPGALPRDGGTFVEDLGSFIARMSDEPEPGWHVAGLIPDEGICLWHGQPRDFKSLCAQHTALCLASGSVPFFNPRFTIERAVRVAYFTNEDSERLFYRRMKWLTASAEPGAADPERNLFPFVRRALTFDSTKGRDAIMRAIDECRAEVAIFDPGRSFSGFFDRGPSDFAPIAGFLRRLQNETTAKTLSVVHHDIKPIATTTAANPERSRSQLASGGGIFSVSDCPVSFRKLDWNRCAVLPQDYKLTGDPKPFEVVFESDSWVDDNGSHRFGSWIRPVATSKDERDIGIETSRNKILEFLRARSKVAVDEPGRYASTDDISKGASVRGESTARALEQLRSAGLVVLATGPDAKALGRSPRAKLWATPQKSPHNNPRKNTQPTRDNS